MPAHDTSPTERPPPAPTQPAVEALRQAALRALAWVRAQRPALDAALEARSRWFLPAVAAAGLTIGFGLVAWIASATRHAGDAEAAAKQAGSAPSSAAPSSAVSSSAAPSSEPAPSASAAVPSPVAPAATVGCTVAGERRVVAPKAIVPAGVEVRFVGDALAVGFAPGEHQGVVDRLDPATLATTSSATAHSRYTVRRVTPVDGGNGIAALVDADRKGDALQGRRTVATDPPLQIGVADGALQWSKPNGTPAAKLWDLEGDGDVDALRIATDDAAAEKTMGVVFRRGNAVSVGLASAPGDSSPPTARGGLTRFVSAGPAIGSPAIALQNGVVFMAWADRGSSDDPWRVRWVRFKAGEAPGEPATFSPPAGGPGEQAMSPAVVAVPGKRFLLVWTEGPQSRHDVRALTFGEDGAPIGAPLVLSAEGANAGQGQATVGASGRGAVAFLESTDDGAFEVAVAPISCAADGK
jgi:hypothetical protein